MNYGTYIRNSERNFGVVLSKIKKAVNHLTYSFLI